MPGRIVSYADPERQLAIVDFAGTKREVNTALVAKDDVPPVPGDWVLVHLGIALHQVDPEEADQTQTFFDDLLAEFEVVAAAREEQAYGGHQGSV